MTAEGLSSAPLGAVVALAAVLGLIFGSFVTALSYRLPRGISIAKGRSACPACGVALTARDLVPVASWVAHGGACRRCGARVSWRYPAIELGMAALFVAAALLVADPVRLILVLAATPVMVALAVIDIEHRRLPNVLLGFLALLALGLRIGGGDDIAAAGLAAAGVFVAGLALDRVARRFGVRQGLGMGDAKLMAVVALALPLPLALAALGTAALLGVAVGLARRREDGGFPFGPLLLLGLWAGLCLA